MKTSKRYHAKLGAEGDAADFSQWLCFVGGHKDQRWALWLTSGEIDGGMISDFTLKRVGSDANVDSRCRSLSASLEEPTTSPTKLQLGMSESDLTLALGAPTSRRSDLFYYAYQHDFKRHGEPYTLMNTITVRIKNGVVVGIKIWKSTQS